MAADITILSNHNSYITRFTYLSTARQSKLIDIAHFICNSTNKIFTQIVKFL